MRLLIVGSGIALIGLVFGWSVLVPAVLSLLIAGAGLVGRGAPVDSPSRAPEPLRDDLPQPEPTLDNRPWWESGAPGP